MDLSVIILNWNTRKLLQECLQTLTRPHNGLDVEVIVVDNASSDDSRDMVRREFPQVKLIANPMNLGFGAGNNVGIPTSAGRYVLFLNSDTQVTEGALKSLVDYADANPDVGILGPKLLNADGSLQYSCRQYPNLATGFLHNTPLGRLLPKNRHAADYLMKNWDHATPRDVDWVSGAALMIRRACLDQIGGFDEDYYMYCEDVDLCWRANHVSVREKGTGYRLQVTGNREQGTEEKTEGADVLSTINYQLSTKDSCSLFPVPCSLTWRVTYLPDAIIYHYIGKSSDQAPTRMTYEFHRSQYLFYKKHYRAQTSFLLRPLILPGIALRAVGQILRWRVRYWQRKLAAWRKKRSAPVEPKVSALPNLSAVPHIPTLTNASVTNATLTNAALTNAALTNAAITGSPVPDSTITNAATAPPEASGLRRPGDAS